jgi:hypothetical protein
MTQGLTQELVQVIQEDVREALTALKEDITKELDGLEQIGWRHECSPKAYAELMGMLSSPELTETEAWAIHSQAIEMCSIEKARTEAPWQTLKDHITPKDERPKRRNDEDVLDTDKMPRLDRHNSSLLMAPMGGVVVILGIAVMIWGLPSANLNLARISTLPGSLCRELLRQTSGISLHTAAGQGRLESAATADCPPVLQAHTSPRAPRYAMVVLKSPCSMADCMLE